MRKLKSTRPSVKTIAMDSTGDVIANGDALGEIPSSQTNGEAEVKVSHIQSLNRILISLFWMDIDKSCCKCFATVFGIG